MGDTIQNRLDKLSADLLAESSARDQLQDISTNLIRQTTVPALMEGVLNAAKELTGADFGNVQMYDPADNKLKIVAQSGFDENFLAYFTSIDIDENSACAVAIKSNKRIVVPDVSASEIFDDRSRDTMLQAGVRACQSTPLFGRNGNLRGVLSTAL